MSFKEKITRVVLWLSVLGHLAFSGGHDLNVPCRLAGTIQACNGDYGIGFLMSAQEKITEWLTGAAPCLGPRDASRFLFVALLLTVLAACLPPTRLPVALGVALGSHLLISCVFLDNLGYQYRAWGGLTTFQCVLFLAIGLQPRPGKIGWTSLIVLGLMIAFSPVIRGGLQAIPLSMLVTLGLVLAASYLILLFPPWKGQPSARQFLRGTGMRTATLVLLLAAQLVLVRFAVLMVCSCVYRIPPWRLEMPEHGSGFPLYLSLGMVSNPYNIAWEDEIGHSHGELTAGRPPGDLLTRAVALQKPLEKEYLRLVREAPDLFLANVLSRTGELGRNMFFSSPGTVENELWRERNSWRAQGLPVIFVAAVLALLASLVLLIRRPGVLLGLFLSGALAVVLTANAPALLIYTGYPWDTCASLLALTFVVLPAAWCFARVGPILDPRDPLPGESAARFEKSLLRRLAIGLTSVLVLGLTGGGLWAAWCHGGNIDRAERIAARTDPVAEIHALGYRYASWFNRMSEKSQQQVLERLESRGHPDVFCFATGDGQQTVFHPEVAVLADGKLYLVCRLNDSWQAPAEFFDQGRVNSYVHVVRDTDEVLGRWPFHMDQGTAAFHRINDCFWESRHRMFCLPCGDKFQPREAIHVGCFNIVGRTRRGWQLEPVATATLTQSTGGASIAP